MTGKVRSDPLFVGLTRPTLILGVSLKYALLNLLTSAVSFIQTSDFRVILIALIIHAVGYYLYFKESRFLELYLIKLSKCNNCPNRIYYGANSYIF